MSGLLGAVATIAVVDSINPSALLVTLYLLLDSRSPVRTVLAYVSGVFVAYLGIGILLMLGLEAVRTWAGAYLATPVVTLAQGVLGLGMLGYACLAPSTPAADRTATPARLHAPGAIFVLGISVTVVEFTTALPYLGALTLLTSADLPLGQWLAILVGYNVVFVLPPLGLLLAYQVAGERLQARVPAWRAQLQRGTQHVLLWIIGLVGFWLLADSVTWFLVGMPCRSAVAGC